MTRTAQARTPIAVPTRPGTFAEDWIRRVEPAFGLLPKHPSSEADWEARLDELAGRAPAVAVWKRAVSDASRLGADSESIASAEALRDGQALCVATGQQPGLFLGPLYTVYKAMTAVALARRITEKSGKLTVPVFWNAADDSDFGEVARARLPGENYKLAPFALSGDSLPAGGLVGALPVSETEQVLKEASRTWEGEPASERVVASVERAMKSARDHGELTTALLYDLMQGTGLVVVDARWTELRRASAWLFEKYAENRARAAQSVIEAGANLEQLGYGAKINDTATISALFDVSSGVRVPFDGSDQGLLDRVREDPETMSPNVTLRPLVQDSVLPNVATVGGPSEIHYHAQLTGMYEILGVTPPILFPRFSATLVPEGVYALAERRELDPADLIEDFDAALRRTAEAALPVALREALDRLESDWGRASQDFRQEAEAFDAKLVQALDDTDKRARTGLTKLRERVVTAARAMETKRDPAVKEYREFLRPRGIPQERVLSSLSLFLASQGHPVQCLEAPLVTHLESCRDGSPSHWLLSFRGCEGEDA